MPRALTISDDLTRCLVPDAITEAIRQGLNQRRQRHADMAGRRLLGARQRGVGWGCRVARPSFRVNWRSGYRKLHRAFPLLKPGAPGTVLADVRRKKVSSRRAEEQAGTAAACGEQDEQQKHRAETPGGRAHAPGRGPQLASGGTPLPSVAAAVALGAALGSVVNDSPQPQVPLALGLMNTNSDLRRGP